MRFFQLICLLMGLLLVSICHAAPMQTTVSLSLRGIHQQLAHEINRHMPTLPLPEPVTDEKINSLTLITQKNLKELLATFGYYHAKITPLKTTQTPLTLNFQITLNAPVILKKHVLTLQGAAQDDATISKNFYHFPLKAGDILNQLDYENYKNDLLSLLESEGYFDAKLTTHEIIIDLEKNTALIYFTVHSGKKSTFGAVHFVKGPYATAFLNRFIQLTPGEPFANDKIITLENKLSASGYFQDVTIDTLKQAKKNNQVPLFVRWLPVKRFSTTLGIGAGTDTGLRGVFAWNVKRLNQYGHQLGFEVKPAQYQQTVQAYYNIPGKNPVSDRWQLLARLQNDIPLHRELNNFQSKIKLSYTQGDVLSGWQQVYALSYQHDLYQTPIENRQSDLILPEITFRKKQVDTEMNPQNGYYFNTHLRGAHRLFGSSTDLGQVITQARFARNIGKHHRVRIVFNAGASLWDKRRTIPPSLRFYAGGIDSVRGFAYQSLGPSQIDNKGRRRIEGGAYLLSSSFEYELKFNKHYGLAAFFDVGNAFDHFNVRFAQGAGLGLRWHTPIGPLRIDVANALSKPNKPWRVHFSIGPDI